MSSQIQVRRMMGPGSDMINVSPNGLQKQGMFAQALSRLLSDFIGPQVKPIPRRIEVEMITDGEGYTAIKLVPHF